MDDPYKAEVYSQGIILFKLIFKTFPYSPDKKVAEVLQRRPSFLTVFVKSSKNIYKVQPSAEIMDLLQNMLTPYNSKRISLK